MHVQMKVRIIWDYISPRKEHWLEWCDENGKTHLRRVTQDEYYDILEKSGLLDDL